MKNFNIFGGFGEKFEGDVSEALQKSERTGEAAVVNKDNDNPKGGEATVSEVKAIDGGAVVTLDNFDNKDDGDNDKRDSQNMEFQEKSLNEYARSFFLAKEAFDSFIDVVSASGDIKNNLNLQNIDKLSSFIGKLYEYYISIKSLADTINNGKQEISDLILNVNNGFAEFNAKLYSISEIFKDDKDIFSKILTGGNINAYASIVEIISKEQDIDENNTKTGDESTNIVAETVPENLETISTDELINKIAQDSYELINEKGIIRGVEKTNDQLIQKENELQGSLLDTNDIFFIELDNRIKEHLDDSQKLIDNYDNLVARNQEISEDIKNKIEQIKEAREGWKKIKSKLYVLTMTGNTKSTFGEVTNTVFNNLKFQNEKTRLINVIAGYVAKTGKEGASLGIDIGFLPIEALDSMNATAVFDFFNGANKGANISSFLDQFLNPGSRGGGSNANYGRESNSNEAINISESEFRNKIEKQNGGISNVAKSLKKFFTIITPDNPYYSSFIKSNKEIIEKIDTASETEVFQFFTNFYKENLANNIVDSDKKREIFKVNFAKAMFGEGQNIKLDSSVMSMIDDLLKDDGEKLSQFWGGIGNNQDSDQTSGQETDANDDNSGSGDTNLAEDESEAGVETPNTGLEGAEEADSTNTGDLDTTSGIQQDTV